MNDPILDGMAQELRRALVERGLDPADPPTSKAPTTKAFDEYQRRGGSQYTNPDDMAVALVKRVSEVDDR